MVNKTYLKTQSEEELVKKINENTVYFSKFFGENAKERMLELLKLKANGQKVLFIVSNENYFEFASFKSEYFDVVTLSSMGLDYKTVSSYINTIDESIRCILAIGGDCEVSIAKYIAKQKGLELILYITKFVSLDAFLPFSFFYKNGIIQKFNTQISDYIYIDTDELVKNTKREDLADAVFNIISKLGIVVENYIFCCLQKDNGYQSYIKDFILQYSKLDKILDSAIDLRKEDILKLMDLNMEFAQILCQINYSVQDKETQFAIIYKYLNKESKQTINALKAIGLQVFVKLYKDFMQRLDDIDNSFYDIEKRIDLFDKMLSFADLEFDIGKIVSSKEIYLLKRFKIKIIEKLELINSIIDKLMYKTLDLFLDSGYTFLNNIEQDFVMKSVYFTADICGEKTLLKTMRNLGVLDFYY